jgi:hypothetical protein
MIIDYKQIAKYAKAHDKAVRRRDGSGSSSGGRNRGGNPVVISGNVKKVNSLEYRIALYKVVIKALSKLTNYECLEKSKEDKYNIKEVVNFDKRFGSKSRYGVIFLAHVAEKSHKLLMVSKVMKENDSNLGEIDIMKMITDKVLLKNKSKHFVFLYKYFQCEKAVFAVNKRLISINELVTGDIKTLFENKTVLNNDELMMNILFQTFISIGTFQNLVNHVHKDTHYGNFLYQENYETGYYDYVFKKKHYYLKACAYNIMIYDFGFSQNINYQSKLLLYNKNISLDYLRITNAFLNKKYGWGEYYDLPKPMFNNNMLNIISILESSTYHDQSAYFERILQYILIPYSPAGMFLTVRPPNVINAKPYKID